MNIDISESAVKKMEGIFTAVKMKDTARPEKAVV